MNTIFTFEKIYKAYIDCRKTKRKTINALKFEYNLERNIFQLKKELETRVYEPGRSICFVVKNPSPREIFAASFKDRVVHHILIKEIEKIGEKLFIFDTFSCRKNKGTHLAVGRLKSFIKKATENYKKEAFYLQLDISGFFMAIDHNILYKIFEEMIAKQKKPKQWKDELLWLAKIIIFHKPTENFIIKSQPCLFNLIPQRKSLFYAPIDRGLPIGNYSSQFFANLYLNKLDQFVKQNIGCQYYVRYVDDFILLGKDKKAFGGLENKINQFLQAKLSLKLNLAKTKFLQVSKGIEFLGYFLKPSYVLVKNSVIGRFKNKLYNLRNKMPKNLDEGFVLSMWNSYYGHFNHACSFNLRKHIYETSLGGGGLDGRVLASQDYKKIINFKKVEN